MPTYVNHLMHFDLQYRLPKDLGLKRAVTNDFNFQGFDYQEPFLFQKIQIKTKSIILYNLTSKNNV